MIFQFFPSCRGVGVGGWRAGRLLSILSQLPFDIVNIRRDGVAGKLSILSQLPSSLLRELGLELRVHPFNSFPVAVARTRSGTRPAYRRLSILSQLPSPRAGEGAGQRIPAFNSFPVAVDRGVRRLAAGESAFNSFPVAVGRWLSGHVAGRAMHRH